MNVLRTWVPAFALLAAMPSCVDSHNGAAPHDEPGGDTADDRGDGGIETDGAVVGVDSGARPIADVPPPVVTIATYPKVDGSTSTIPIARLVACELLGMRWSWQWETDAESGDYIRTIAPLSETPDEVLLSDQILAATTHTNTHSAYTRLTDGDVDLILVASEPSPDERAYADSVGVTLEWKPIGLDALVVLVNAENSLGGLTTEQVRSIYTAGVTAWSDVGGGDGAIDPYVRPTDSGSQQLFQELLMADVQMATWPSDRTATYMGALLDQVQGDPLSIGYSVYYLVTYQYENSAKMIALDGIAPNVRTIADRTYPYVAPVLVVTRADLDAESAAHQMREWLIGPSGQSAIAKTGYVPVALGDPRFGEDFSGMNFIYGPPLAGADMKWAKLTDANLSVTDASNADFTGADLTGATLSNAIFASATLNVTRLSSANLDGATFDGASMTGADLSRASLVGTTLTGADLKGALLIDATLTRTDLSGADLTGAVLDGVTWSSTICVDGENSDNAGGTCAGHLVPASG